MAIAGGHAPRWQGKHWLLPWCCCRCACRDAWAVSAGLAGMPGSLGADAQLDCHCAARLGCPTHSATPPLPPLPCVAGVQQPGRQRRQHPHSAAGAAARAADEGSACAGFAAVLRAGVHTRIWQLCCAGGHCPALLCWGLDLNLLGNRTALYSLTPAYLPPLLPLLHAGCR